MTGADLVVTGGDRAEVVVPGGGIADSGAALVVVVRQHLRRGGALVPVVGSA